MISLGGSITVPTALYADNPITKTQFDTKQDTLSYVKYDDTNKSITIDGFTNTNALGNTDGFMFQGAQYTPTGKADPNGSVGSFCFDNDYLYYKSSAGWGYYSKITLLP